MTERVLVTGASGMLGSQLLRTGPAVPTDLADTDLAEPGQVRRLFAEQGPFSGVIHAAGYTDVDGAESHEEEARRGNFVATRVLAEECARTRTRLLVVSTDFVFDGSAGRPYREDDAPNPLGAYGRTKLEAERAAREIAGELCVIVRTQWLYGPRGRHFPGTILAMEGPLRVVDDQRGSPTSTLELAPALWDVLREGGEPLYHAACEGECSWYEFARFLRPDRDDVEPCATAELPRPARRPAYSVLDCSRLAALRGRSLAHWRDAWREFAKQEQ